ncbi:hypothetical protein [Cohnella endophytica]|uniref:hypothetical protein n=1 Tax=Cohnella endophytica TaxID=2419778 RepID=UPI0018F7A18E|nr:hypothetical protein [Cohnella endophytica]
MTTSNGARVKLSQWDSLMVESLRSLGWTNEELIRRVQEGAGELPKDDSDFQFDYEALAAFARQEPETFRNAVNDGYQIKYNTIRGIRSWILVALGKQAELALEEGNESATASLTSAERDRMASVLSFGWSLEDAAGLTDEAATTEKTYRIAPTRQ